jgi:hypothetical protein
LNRFNKNSGILAGKSESGKIERDIVMKKLMLITALLALTATPSLATTSLGYWNEGDPGTTHQFWDFTPASVNPGNHNQFYPESEFNPNDPGKQVYAQTVLGTWDGISAITGNTIVLDLKINDYLNYNNYKYVWVNLGLTNGSVFADSLAAAAPGIDVAVTNLQGPGPGTGADFGFFVVPNPYFEDILINIHADSVTAPAILDWIHVDTICTIPEPATLLLLGLGTAMISRLRKK